MDRNSTLVLGPLAVVTLAAPAAAPVPIEVSVPVPLAKRLAQDETAGVEALRAYLAQRGR